MGGIPRVRMRVRTKPNFFRTVVTMEGEEERQILSVIRRTYIFTQSPRFRMRRFGGRLERSFLAGYQEAAGSYGTFINNNRRD